MSKSLKFTLSFGLLAAIGMTGCDKGSTDQAAATIEQAADQVGQAAAAVEQAADSVATNAAGNGSGPNGAQPKQSPIDMIKERLKPENIGPTLDGAFASFQSEIEKLTDPTKAAEVVPKVDKMLSQFDMMAAMAPMVPPESREVIVDRITNGMGPLQSAVDKLYENEEIKAIVQPTFDRIMEKFAAMKSLFAPAPPQEDPAATDEAASEEAASEEAPSEEADAAVE